MFNYAKGYTYTKQVNTEMLGIDPIVEEMSKHIYEKGIQEQEKIIKEVALQGYKYLLIKTETEIVENSATLKYKYHGMDEMSVSAIKMFEEEGYRVYGLDKVREYLKAL